MSVAEGRQATLRSPTHGCYPGEDKVGGRATPTRMERYIESSSGFFARQRSASEESSKRYERRHHWGRNGQPLSANPPPHWTYEGRMRPRQPAPSFRRTLFPFPSTETRVTRSLQGGGGAACLPRPILEGSVPRAPSGVCPTPSCGGTRHVTARIRPAQGLMLFEGRGEAKLPLSATDHLTWIKSPGGEG